MKLKKVGLGLFFLIFISAITYMSSCVFSSKTSLKLLEKGMKEKYDIIIVPGCPPEEGKWTTTMKGRIYWSKYLYDKGITKNVMYSGNAVYSPYYEGVIMALYAEAIGIPKEHIYTELLAEHSTENIYYSYKKSIKLGFKKIALASDPLQTKMLSSFTRKKVSPDIGFLPMIIDTLKAMEPAMIDPEIDFSKAYVKDFVSLPKRQNFFKRFLGSMSFNMNKNVYD
jgi:hypothetical protein